MKKCKKRSFLLLEVVVAIVLVSISSIFMLSSEKGLMLSLRKNKAVCEKVRIEDIAFAKFYEKLHRNNIPWRSLKEGGRDTEQAGAWEITYTYGQYEKRKDKKDRAMVIEVNIEVANRHIKSEKKYHFCVKKEVAQDA